MKTPDLRVASLDDVTFLARVVFVTHEKRYATRPGWDPEAFYRGLLDDAADQVAGRPEAGTTLPVVLDVDIDNPRAQTLYERLGFVVAACIDHDRRRMVRVCR